MQQCTAIQELARQGLNISDIQRETGFPTDSAVGHARRAICDCFHGPPHFEAARALAQAR